MASRSSEIRGATWDDVRGRSDNVSTRTIAALDYDEMAAGTTLDDIEMAMRIDMDGHAYAAHTTFRHTPEAPRFCVYVSLSRTVSADEYDDVINSIRDTSRPFFLRTFNGIKMRIVSSACVIRRPPDCAARPSHG